MEQKVLTMATNDSGIVIYGGKILHSQLWHNSLAQIYLFGRSGRPVWVSSLKTPPGALPYNQVYLPWHLESRKAQTE